LSHSGAVYLDTSALVKLYAEEESRELVFEAVDSSEVVATSTVAYAEARAALSRRRREGYMNEEECQRAVEHLNREWRTYERLAVSNYIAYSAGELADSYALRGFDAVHLASALHLAERFEESSFLAFDERLSTAAKV
jgi:predicted nucleic acid-binding protein